MRTPQYTKPIIMIPRNFSLQSVDCAKNLELSIGKKKKLQLSNQIPNKSRGALALFATASGECIYIYVLVDVSFKL